MTKRSSALALSNMVQKDSGLCSEVNGVCLLTQVEPRMRDWLSRLQDKKRLGVTLRALMRERAGENTPVSRTRCGLCCHFREGTCPLNDLYLNPDTLVYPYFAEKCEVYEK